MYHFFIYGVLILSTRSCFTCTAMQDDGQTPRQCVIKSGFMSRPGLTFKVLYKHLTFINFQNLKCKKDSIYF